MIQHWSSITVVVNIVGLAVSLCLGLYVLTRTPHSSLSRLAALTLWSVTGFCLHNVLLITWPGSGVLPALRPVALLALAFGFHLALLLPPRGEPGHLDFYQPAVWMPAVLRRRLGRLEAPIRRVIVPLVYTWALALILSGVFPTGGGLADLAPEGASRPAVYLSNRTANPLYFLAIAFVVLLTLLAFVHLWQSRKEEESARRRLWYTQPLTAVLLAGLGGLYLSLGVFLRLDVPSVPGDIAVSLAAILLGYTVARYHARMEGRIARRDLLYVSLAITILTLSYVVVAELLYLGGHRFSTVTLVLIIVAAASSLMLYDGLRAALDRLFYRGQFRQLRANLRALAREAGVGQGLSERLQTILNALCGTIHVKRGFIALRVEEAFVCQASEKAIPLGQALSLSALSAAEISDLPLPDVEGPEGMALLVPVWDGDDQIGALVLGPKDGGEPFGEDDLLLLDDLAEQLATVIQTSHVQEENAVAISEMIADFREREQTLQRQVQQMLAEREEEARPILEGIDEKAFAAVVEDALRRLYDYPYLGQHELAKLRVVNWCMEDEEEDFLTHVDCGKAVSEVLIQALQKLRPPGPEPKAHQIPPREWHLYVVLHDAYVLGDLNRDIMSKLYISEGTFNRTRRRAIRSVAKVLQEMERGTRRREEA